MARYIDEKDVYKLVEPSGVSRVHCSQIDELPRADVAPKSEVERLEHLRAELSKEVYRLKDDNKFLQDRRFKEWSEVKQEVAREIFEEIDKVMTDHACGAINDHWLYVRIEEIEKKYLEGE